MVEMRKNDETEKKMKEISTRHERWKIFRITSDAKVAATNLRW